MESVGTTRFTIQMDRLDSRRHLVDLCVFQVDRVIGAGESVKGRIAYSRVGCHTKKISYDAFLYSTDGATGKEKRGKANRPCL
jgi:hypothetical protein